MATVRASCAECGDVELPLRQVQIQRCETTAVSTYSFQCPRCRLRVCKPAAPQVVQTLLGAGVAMVSWQLPAELSEPKCGPPITPDDLLAFHFALADDERTRQFLAHQRATQD